MVDHGARDHAPWSASATAANVQCPGRMALAANAPAQPESIHAARGTACHQVAEKCLRGGLEPSSFLGAVERTKEHEIEVDEEIVSSSGVYVDYVLGELKHGNDMKVGTELQVEQGFSLASLNPPFEAGGTADAVLHHRVWRELQVVDLKHGVGVVDVEGNPQLRTYALGAMLANPGLAVDRITVTIVQPRAPHRDGRIRSETFHVADLVEWTADLLSAMYRSKLAMDTYPGPSPSLALDEWSEKHLRPGRCKWCPVEATCPANRRERLERVDARLVERYFEDVTPKRTDAPDLTEAELVARDLEGIDALEDWIKARRAHAHALAERGDPPPGWILVEKQGLRKWACPDEAKLVSDLKAVAGLSEDDVYERKLRTPAAIDKLLGKVGAQKISSMWHRPVTGTNLVRAEKTTRPAAAPTVADRYFQPEN